MTNRWREGLFGLPPNEIPCLCLVPLYSYGNFSTVWRGTWQGQIVAIKQLDELTDKEVSVPCALRLDSG